MHTEVFALCDAATDNAGKLNILGSFDTLFTNATPAKHPACAVAIRLRFIQEEEGHHKIHLVIIDEDGGQVVPPLNGSIHVKVNPGYSTASMNLIVNFQGLEIKRYGEHRVEFRVDDRVIATLPLYVKKNAKPA